MILDGVSGAVARGVGLVEAAGLEARGHDGCRSGRSSGWGDVGSNPNSDI